MATTTWAQITGSGTSDDPYVLHTAADWATFAGRITGSQPYADSFFKLSDTWDNSANPVTVTAGTEGFPFTGTFDGNFRTLTVNINQTSTQGTAPFCHICCGAIIKNLTVVGNVNGTTHAAGLVGISRGITPAEPNIIENCTVAVNITVNTGSNKHMGGVVGHGKTSYLTIKNTVFCGTMSNGGDYAGGLMGWSDGNSLTIDNCLFAGSYLGDGLVHPIAVRGNNKPMALNVKRAYYTTEPTLTDEGYIVVAGTRVYLSPLEDLFCKACQLIDGHQYYAPCTVSGINAFYAYNDGSAITLGYTVKGTDGLELTKNTDYTENITNSYGETVATATDMGDYTLMLTGLPSGGCFGSYSQTFSVIEANNSGAFLIEDAAGWEAFAQRVNNGETGLDGVLISDIDLGNSQTMVGTSNNKYSGRFDGNGHTLTVHYNTSAEYTAPFRFVEGGRVYNLHTAGTIQTSAKFAAGIVSNYYGERSALMNCRSSVTIISSVNGDGTHGGLIAVADGDTFEKPLINHCVFDGKLLTTGGTTNCSGLVGEAYNHLSIYNCLSSPAELAEGETPCGSCNTLYHIDTPQVMQGQATNYYLPASYMTTLQGDDASPYTPEELVQRLGNEWSLLEGNPVPIHKGCSVIDRAIVRFGEGRQLPKFQIRENSTKLFIPQDNGNYAVVSTEHQGEMPVNFKAKENGTYTLNLSSEGTTFNYLHLIDNLTGNDVNLLQTPNYTFEAKTGDYASRFKLVFATSDANEDNPFAFISNGEIVVNGEGTLQVIDMLGHILISRLVVSGSSLLSSDYLTNGVYVLRLINGEIVRTQKIIVK